MLCGASLVVQWLRLCALNAGGMGSIAGQGTRSHMPQLKILNASTKTRCSQIHKLTLKKKKDDAVKVLHSICQHIWKTQQWPQDWKRSVFIPISKKGNAKECSNYHTIVLISHASKVMLKILQVRIKQYMNQELSDVQAGF